jgi:hypothetical protein
MSDGKGGRIRRWLVAIGDLLSWVPGAGDLWGLFPQDSETEDESKPGPKGKSEHQEGAGRPQPPHPSRRR